jgi:anti-sigma regulatory factor (Ser/Thr protein kinase)
VLDPTEEVNMDRMGGRGLLLIQSFMDEVKHNADGNSITMVKNVVPLESSGDGSAEAWASTES